VVKRWKAVPFTRQRSPPGGNLWTGGSRRRRRHLWKTVDQQHRAHLCEMNIASISIHPIHPLRALLQPQAMHASDVGCQPVSGISGRRHLRSADRGHLDFPCVRLASHDRGRSFVYTPVLRIGTHFLLYLRDSSLYLSSFKHHLKTFLFSFY